MIPTQLLPATRLFARLLLRELDEDTLSELRVPEVESALAAVGVRLPAESDLDALAAEYFALFLQPAEGGPLIQSLLVEGTYEGETTRTVRALAAAAGLEFDRLPARGAPPDHLGSILLLYCEASTVRPEVAVRLASDHLTWSLPTLERHSSRGGFYGPLCGASAELIRSLIATEQEALHSSLPGE